MRQQQRALKRTNRDLERDRHSLERQEKQLVSTLRACDSHVIHVTSVLVLLSGFHHAMCTSPIISLQEAEIKKAAKRGDKQVRQLAGYPSLSDSKLRIICFASQTCAVYAKQLVRIRQQKAKSMGMSSKITSTGHQMQVRTPQEPLSFGTCHSEAKRRCSFELSAHSCKLFDPGVISHAIPVFTSSRSALLTCD